MNNIVNEAVEAYIRDVLPKSKGVLKEMEAYAEVNHVPIIHPEVAKLLEVLTKIHKPQQILEVGTAIGYSAMILCNASDQGQLISIERRTDMIEKAASYIQRAGLENQIRILYGNAEEILPTIDQKFDMIFLDAAKGQYMEFLSSCIHLLREGGILISDNVLYKGMVASNEYVIRRKKTIVKRMRTYLDYIMDHTSLTSCLLPVGDGIAISYKNTEVNLCKK
ncbi:putative O-methyltransferase YrrM [Anaerosolibacter carboniphilus]|uniref:tRNA 5-hydroxyuridine methyltransferase n=1 Tax=Anaerosolibacter carboniphilus TaxID=1417629 RepID=A0A841KX78_9FIRM|nr:O-methyltransferase [Anaerosolibacter carboniphilus]MBB6214789.1 putative O-methyltransferase YrrM [Anaerosolibacter carboniphilus]